VHKIHREQGQGSIPQIVEGVGHAALFDQPAVLEPDHLQLVEGTSVGDALEFGDGTLTNDNNVLWRDDDSGWDIGGLGRVNRELDVVGVLLLAQLGVRGSHPGLNDEKKGLEKKIHFRYSRGICSRI
jgi:hypothetical protein